jgi:hypothetical protein
MQLPESVEKAVAPLFAAYPIESMLGALVPSEPGPADAVRMVNEIISEPAISAHPALVAGLWLYVDELDRSHQISQQMKNVTGSFWHGIMHRREGDFWNAKYWFERCGAHPAMARIKHYDPYHFVDAVEAVEAGRSADEAALAALQRQEWEALFSWCAQQAEME